MAVFSVATLAKFEDASAGIPLRPLVALFEAAGIRPGDDPGGVDGARKIQFRRYVASIDQRDARQVDRLADALGAMVGEVATSKIAFLVSAAESDGFAFADGTFRPANVSASGFTISGVSDFHSIDERLKRLDVLADTRPQDAIAGVNALVDSMCRTILRDRAKPAPKSGARLATLAPATLRALAIEIDRDAIVALATLIASIEAMPAPSPVYAKLATGTAGTFVRFLAGAAAHSKNE